MAQAPNPGLNHPLFLDILASMRGVYQIVVKQRDQRLTFEPDPLDSNLYEAGYAIFERKAMWFAVNCWRGACHLPPVSLSAIRSLEIMAQGYPDFAIKFTRYCAELAMGVTPRV